MTSHLTHNRFMDFLDEQLRRSVWWTEKTSVNDTTYQALTCPVCNIKGCAWAYRTYPLSINCNRLNECGARTKTVDLFNSKQTIEKQCKPTKDDPDKPARAYLMTRSLRHSLKGLNFSYWPNVRNSGRGAVMFLVGKDRSGKPVYNGRLINPGPLDAKQHNSGSTSSQFWQHPGFEYDLYKPTFVTEGIIDALSIIEMGNQAVSVLAAGQDPAKVDLSPFHCLVLAFDSDQAGIRATKKWKAHFPDAETIMPDKGQDWNDILCSGLLEEVTKKFNDNHSRYLINAALGLANSAHEYASIYLDYFKIVPGLFDFNSCTHFSYQKDRGDNKYLTVERCGKFTLKVISFLKDNSNPHHPEFRYNLKISPQTGTPVHATATGRDLATPRGIKEFFLSHAKISYEAGAHSCTALATKIASAHEAPEVRQLSETGYDVKSGLYVYEYFAIDAEGQMLLPTAQGLYKINQREWCTPPSHSTDKAIKPAANQIDMSSIHNLVVRAWGENGAAAFAWMIAGWFVNQIKDRIGYFPFLSLYGDPASGKSALTVMLNAMQGIDGEGFPLSQLNTKKALARSISRISGMFTALLEDNQRNERAFDYSILLTAYNQGPLQLKAAFSNDNRTLESPFRGTLMFVQNVEPFNQKAEKQRVISLQFDHQTISGSTRQAYEELVSMPQSELAQVLVYTLRRRTIFEARWYEAFKEAIVDLSTLDNQRILENHALLLAWHRLFCQEFNITCELKSFLHETALLKCQTSALRDYNQADHFFETIDMIDETKTKNCLHMDPEKDRIYINLPGIEQVIRSQGIQFSVSTHLTDALKRHSAFVENSRLYRFPEGQEVTNLKRAKQRRVWVFDATKFE